jgi:hypothetical protein
MRLASSVIALTFLLVAIAAGMWPSWALASASATWDKKEPVLAEQASPTLGSSAFRPCYSTVRTAAASCFPQLGLPDGHVGNPPDISRHCMPANGAHAMTPTVPEAELRPPRPFADR